jgi:hypothetical protein
MNTIKSIEYIVHSREMYGDFCIIESMKLSNSKTYQRGIRYGLSQLDAEALAECFQVKFEGWGDRPACYSAGA